MIEHLVPGNSMRQLLTRVAWISFAVGVPLGVFFAPLSHEQLKTVWVLCAALAGWIAGSLIGDVLGMWLFRLPEGRFVRRG